MLEKLLASIKPDVSFIWNGQIAGANNVNPFYDDVPVGPPAEKRLIVISATSVRGSGLTNTITGCTINGVAANQISSLGTGNNGGASAQLAMFWLEVPTGNTIDVQVTLAALTGTVVNQYIDVFSVYNYDSPTPIVDAGGGQVQPTGSAVLSQTMNIKAGGLTIISDVVRTGGYTPSRVTINTSLGGSFDSAYDRGPSDQSQAYSLDCRILIGAHWR